MNILITNDDGIFSPGIKILADKFAEKHNVTVVAPKENKSATGHALTIGRELILKKEDISDKYPSWSMTGTPADCIKFAYHCFKDFKPDIVVSGINNGPNLATDVVYSGTLSAAIEGVYLGLPSFAVSSTVYENNNFEQCAAVCYAVFEAIIKVDKMPAAYNINVPNGKIKGVKFAKLGILTYHENYEKIKDDTFVLSGYVKDKKNNDKDCDVVVCEQGYASVTPIIFNKTDYAAIENLKNMKLKTAHGIIG